MNYSRKKQWMRLEYDLKCNGSWILNLFEKKKQIRMRVSLHSCMNFIRIYFSDFIQNFPYDRLTLSKSIVVFRLPILLERKKREHVSQLCYLSFSFCLDFDERSDVYRTFFIKSEIKWNKNIKCEFVHHIEWHLCICCLFCLFYSYKNTEYDPWSQFKCNNRIIRTK